MKVFENITCRTLLSFLIFSSNIMYGSVSNLYTSFKFYSGYSFSRTTSKQDINILKRPKNSFQPEFSFNYFFPKKNILELGFRINLVGHKIILGEKYMGGSTTVRGISFCLPIIYHKKIGLKPNGLYLSLGTMFSKGSNREVTLVSGDTFYTQATTLYTSNRIHVLIGSRYIFKIKERSIGLEVMYTKGFVTNYQSVTSNIFDSHQNRYINKGSGLHIGLVYFFGKKRNTSGTKTSG